MKNVLKTRHDMVLRGLGGAAVKNAHLQSLILDWALHVGKVGSYLPMPSGLH